MIEGLQARVALALMGIALLTAGGCKKKTPPPPVPDPVPVQKVESKLQITTVSPSSFDEGTAADARIFGSAFVDGATVSVGAAPLDNVTVVDPNTLQVQIPGLSAGTYDVTVRNPDGASATLRQGVTVRAPRADTADCRQATVYFDFDSAGLRADGKRLLDSYGSCYTSLSGTVRVEGHADERGTTDYNLALGQRRASSVQRQLTQLGVPASRIKTVSYGEERPAERGSGESVWAKNRRVEVTAE